MTAVAEATIEQRVAAGAAWLDQHEPGWLDRIDAWGLDLASSCRCILGQVYGSFYAAPDTVLDQAAALGFDVTDTGDNPAEFLRLEGAWWDLIERRRAQAGAAP